MKKIFLTMVALLTMSTMMAQGNGRERKAPKQMTPEEMTSRMTKDLSLSTDQKTKVLSLNKEYKDYLGGPGMGGPGGPRADGNAQKSGGNQRPDLPQMSDAQKEQMQQHMAKRQEYDKKLQKILTSDQYKKYQKQQKRRGPGGQRPERPQNK